MSSEKWESPLAEITANWDSFFASGDTVSADQALQQMGALAGSIRDIIDVSLRNFVTQGIPVRRCKNCGRYFPVTGRVSAEYCERPTDTGKFCRGTASAFFDG